MSRIILDDLLDAIVGVVEEFDLNAIWPCNPIQSEAYFGSMLSWKIFKKFKDNKSSFAKAIEGVGVDFLRFHLLSSGIIGLKAAKIYEKKDITTEDIILFMEAVLGSIERRVESDPLCLDGMNFLISRSKLSELYEDLRFQDVKSENEKRLIAELGVTLESYCWSLYFDAYRDAGFVLHGLYQIDDGKLLVREGFDLQPPFWQEKKFSFKSLKIYCVYDDNVQIKFDYANHIRFERPILPFLKKAAVLLDNNNIDIKKVPEIESQLEMARTTQTKLVESMIPMDLIRKSYEIYSFGFKSFFDFFSENWKPSENEFKKIELIGLKYWNKYYLVKKKRNLRHIYDPRIDFVE